MRRWRSNDERQTAPRVAPQGVYTSDIAGCAAQMGVRQSNSTVWLWADAAYTTLPRRTGDFIYLG